MNNKLISIIVPVFNEEENLVLLYQELIKVLGGLKEKYDYEIIFVNDGSEDKTGQIIGRLVEQNKKVKYLEFSRNFGKEIALSAGLDYAQGAAAIMIDADLEHPPAIIPEFLKKWEKGAEIVVGVREKTEKQGLVKRFGSLFFYKIINLIGQTKIMSQATDYRLIDKKVIREFNRFTERNRIARGLIDWLGFKKDYVYFRAGERKQGRPGYSFLKLFRLALASFVSHSLFPLKLAGYLGIAITLFAGLLGSFIVVEKYILADPWQLNISVMASLAVMILFLVGIVLICLGLIALYIANIHGEVINRPIYVIRKKKNLDQAL